MALRSTQPLTEMSTRNISWGVKADNLPQSCAVVTKSGNLNFLERSGPLRACNGTALPLPYVLFIGFFDFWLNEEYFVYCVYSAFVPNVIFPYVSSKYSVM